MGTGGAQGAGGMVSFPALSGDGRLVVFQSQASDLVPDDTNGVSDIFVRDRQTGMTERVSLSLEGKQFEGTENCCHSASPAISADGRYVTFSNVNYSVSTVQNLYVHDRVTGTTELVSASPEGALGNGDSGVASMSADGRFIAYHSKATNLVTGDPTAFNDVFVYDRENQTTEWVSRAPDGAGGNNASEYPAMSADGRFVAYASLATNLVPEDSNDTQDIFVRDRQLGTTERVSVATDGAQANYALGASIWPAISADGRVVSFSSNAYNLVPGDTNNNYDVFVRDLVADTTERVSVASSGAEGNGLATSWGTGISADGRSVGFTGTSTNLVDGDTAAYDMYVHDRTARTTELVSVTDAGELGNSQSTHPSFSADGRFVSFLSYASNLVPDDTNGFPDVFVRDRGPALGTAGLTVSPSSGEVAVSGFARFPGVELAGAADDPADGQVPASLGGEIVAADVIVRPEEEDLQLRIGLASLPGPVAGGLPGVVYGLELTVGGQRYELRGLRAAATAVPPGAPAFTLSRCQPGCTEIARLTGGIGVRGLDAVVSIPASLIGATPGATVGGLRAFTALGEAATGGLRALDEVTLGSAVIPAPRVHLGIAPDSVSGSDVVFDVEASLMRGRLAGLVPTADLPPGEHRVWARTCLGETCTARWAPIP